jgi:hypothetical protein
LPGRLDTRVDLNRDYDAEEREFYKKMLKYKPHPPWPLQALSPLTPEKDMDDRDGGFGNSFWPDRREQKEIEEIIWQEVRACDGTFLPDNEGTPAWLKKKNGRAYLKRFPTSTSAEPNALTSPFMQKRATSSTQNKNQNNKDLEETAMTMIDWDDDNSMPPLAERRTFINKEGDESSLESDEESVPYQGHGNEPAEEWEDWMEPSGTILYTMNDDKGPGYEWLHEKQEESDDDSDNGSIPPLITRHASQDDDDSSDDDEDDKESSNNKEDIALSNVDKEHTDKIGPNTWLADSGASCHLTNSDEGMFDVQVISSCQGCDMR